MNKLLTWNIRHGGGKRIEQIIGVLQDYLNADFIVLTEIRNNGNFSMISKFLEAEGYDVYFDYPEPGLNSVLIATRYKAHKVSTNNLGVHSHRVLKVSLNDLVIYGCYFPQRNEKKMIFDFIISESKKNQNMVVVGDFNTGKHFIDEKKKTFYCSEYMQKIESNGLKDVFRLIHPTKEEYSWYSNAGNGFRIDHTFVSKTLESSLLNCYYDHKPRECKISDHSIMITTFNH